MKRISLLLLLVVLASGFKVEAGKVTIDFDQPNGKPWLVSGEAILEWSPIQGQWNVKNNKYVQEDIEWTTYSTCNTYHRSYIGNENWTDYTVEATVRIEEGGTLAPIGGIFFRVTNDNTENIATGCNYYFFRIDLRAEEGPCLIKSPNQTIEIHSGKPCKLNTDYTLKVVLKGSSIKCYIDGKLEFDITDESFPTGAVGLGTFNASASFDNLTIEGLEIPNAEDTNLVNIPDPNLRAALEKALGKNEGDAITREELAGLKELNAEGLGITDTVALKYATSLTQLNLEGNQIADITPLAKNIGITGVINLKNNPLTNTALSQIPVLKARGVTVTYDMFEGAVLFKDANLEKAIRDALGIPTELLQKEDLEKLTGFHYQPYDKPEDQKIFDITGLEFCSQLRSLGLSGNRHISDVSLLSNLKKLASLHLNFNQVSDLDPIVDLTKLTNLHVNENKIVDITSLSNLNNMESLGLNHNQVIDLSPLANLSSLKLLVFDGNRVKDLSPLSKLSQIEELSCANNQISDISPLVENTGISGTINLKGNPLSNTALYTHIPALEARGIKVEYDKPPMAKLSFSKLDQVNVDQVFTVDALVDKVHNLAGWTTTIEYNPSLLELQKLVRW